MSRWGFLVWLVLLPIIIYVMGNQGNSSHEDELNNTMHYERDVNFTSTVNHNEDPTRYDQDSVQHDYYNNYTKSFHKRDKQDTPTELRDNHRKIDYRGNFTMSYNFRPENDSNKDNLSKMCNNTVCIPICCELGHRMIEGSCTPDAGDYIFPEVFEVNKKVNDIFQLVVSDPCETTGRLLLNPDVYRKDEYVILINGSIYHPNQNFIVDPTTYCFAVVNKTKYELTKCNNISENDINNPELRRIISVSLIVSLPFLILTFVVYTVLKELRNLHGYIFRGYIGSLFVIYVVFTIQLIPPETFTSNQICIALAFITQFWFSSSFFWLNIMCFDIWWRFGELHPFQESMTREDKKKFIIYSIYAWSCTSIFTIVCAMMDFIPSVPKNFIRPELGKKRCWLAEETDGIYFYGPISVIIVCNICMFISTVLKFMRHKRNITYMLRNSESRRHNANKQTFILYVKLFILMGVSWSMEIISRVFKNKPLYVWYFTDLINSLQGVIIFIMFVLTGKTKKLLLEKFGCQEYTFFLFSKNSPCNGCHNTILPTYRSETVAIPLQDKIRLRMQTNCRAKNLSENNHKTTTRNATQRESFYRTCMADN